MTARRKTFWTFADRFEGDKVVWIILLMLYLLSIVCMFSSSSRLLDEGMSRLDIVREQFITVLGGLAVVIVLYNIKNIKWFWRLSALGFPLTLLLLVLLDIRVQLPFLKAIELNGAYRILEIRHTQIHVFEIVKVAMVMYLAWAIDAQKRRKLPFLKNLAGEWQKIIFIYAPFIATFLLILPGSNSSALFIGMIMYIVILLGGGSLRDMTILAAVGITALMLCFGIYKLSDGKHLQRIGTGVSRVFEDEDMEKQFLESRKGTVEYQEALDAIRQPYAARIAIHEGGFKGKGPGQSTQRYVVPAISEDFIYSFIIEEYGLLGGILVIMLYLSLLSRGSIIVRNCGNDNFAKVAVAGLCILISGQAFLHMFVNADIGPMTGQTLPLISHGMSAFLCFSIAFGIILSFSRMAARRIERETREAAPLGGPRDDVRDRLDDLDEYESGKNSDDIYGI